MSELNLTAMLTTISAASASFVAILGGFIASKLLSINGERDAVAGQIANLSAQIGQKQKKEDFYRYLANKRDAKIFIEEHIWDLYDEKDLQTVYDSDSSPNIDFEDLQPFWQKAVNFKRKFVTIDYSSEEKNKAGIPLSLTVLIDKDNFLEDLLPKLQHVQAEKQRKIMMLQLNKVYVEPSFQVPSISGLATRDWYKKLWDKINDLSWEIDQLELQKELLEQREKELTAPHGMRSGLVIFALFSVFNIVLPLTQCNTVFKNPMHYYGVMLFFMSTFTLGLIATFWYLVSMLKRRPETKNITLPPEEADAGDAEDEEDSE